MNKKGSILAVLKTLQEYSDEDHYLTHGEIIDLIYKNYGILYERKSIATSIELLEEFGYDINKIPKKGSALLSRTFDLTEASFIIDAVFSSKGISGSQAKNICEETYKCFSKYQRQDYSYIYKSSEINRTNNKEILYNVSLIHEAIKRNKRISFQCITYDENGKKICRKEGKTYIVSPYYLVNNFGRYYLIGNQSEKYNDILNYRIDHLINIEIRDDLDRRSFKELKDKYKNFNIINYLNENIYLFSGDTISSRLELLNTHAISFVKDWFGDDIKIINKDNKIYVDVTCNKNALKYWLIQYGECIKVVSPSSFVNEIKDNLNKIISNYNLDK